MCKLQSFIARTFGLSDRLSLEVGQLLYTMKECGEDPKGFYDEMVKGEVTEQTVRALVDTRQNQGRYVSRSVRSPWLLAPKSKAARVQPY